jgi:hypothetical protein
MPLIAFTADQSMDRIAPQMVVIIEIFIAKGQTINALAEQLLDTVLYMERVAVVDEQPAKSPNKPLRCSNSRKTSLPHHWRGIHPRNRPPLFAMLTLEITNSARYTLSSKRRLVCKLNLLHIRNLQQINAALRLEIFGLARFHVEVSTI